MSSIDEILLEFAGYEEDFSKRVAMKMAEEILRLRNPPGPFELDGCTNDCAPVCTCK